MRKLLLIIALLLPVLIYAQKKKTGPSTYDLLIGTYTNGNSKGIYVYRFYVETGRLAYLNQIDDIDNPSYLCVSKNNKFVFAVNESSNQGAVEAFTFEPRLGKLTLINKQNAGGGGPCYVSVDNEQKNLFVANYGTGSLAVIPVNIDGSLDIPSQVIQDQGHGTNKDRQEGPHAHMAMLSPDEKYLLSTDLGTDKLNIYRYHQGRPQPLSPASPSAVSVKDGYGPRHMDFSPDKRHLYLLQEMGSAITVYDYDRGKLREIQTASLLNKGFKGKTGAAAIHIAADGRFLYASNRLDLNEITVFSINQQTGELTFVQRIPSHGKTPRDFTIDPTGNFLLVANQDSDNIVVYKIDKNTGMLVWTGTSIEVGNPACLKFAAAE